ncbi:MAG: hypothetical protein E7271_07045 [Lachnospiraceae bacterium]|nr:hypothetical protein [Lachnospiraceae bacterium]
MYNIVKSLNYSARRDTTIIITIISMLGIPAFVAYLSGMLNGDSMQKMTPSAYFGGQTMGTVFVFTCFGIMILACKLCAGDASDKTINYEFLAGHSRVSIFAGRMVAGFLWGAVLNFIIMMVPVVVFEMLYGWGLETDKTEVLIRCGLVFFAIVRFTAYSMMLATITRSAGKGIALGYATLMVIAVVQSILEEMLDIVVVYPTAFTNACFLLISENSRNVVIDGKTVMLFDTSVTSDMAVKTIIVSLLFTAVYMIITYVNFKKKDRD